MFRKREVREKKLSKGKLDTKSAPSGHKSFVLCETRVKV